MVSVLGVYATLPISVFLLVLKHLPFDVDDFFVDLYYYFHKSAKRREELREFQDFIGISEMKILKDVQLFGFLLKRLLNVYYTNVKHCMLTLTNKLKQTLMLEYRY